MCGIAGIIGIKNQSKSEDLIRQMTDRIAHRGPDSAGHFLFEEGALGHRRLAIIDLNPASNQPFKDVSCLLYTSPSPRDRTRSRMPSSA